MIKLQFPFDTNKFSNLKNIISLNYGEPLEGFYTTNNPHKGIDYALPEGSKVLAAHSGIVEFSGIDVTGYGLLVIIRLENCLFGTLYAHLSDIFVKVGDKINVGQHIGNSGSTGNVTGPHLHFECRMNWRLYKTHVDPNLYLQKNEESNNQAEVLKSGKAIIDCEYAYYRDSSLQYRLGLLKKGDSVTLTGKEKISNNLVFKETIIEQVVWIAEKDGDGTIILKQVEASL